MLGKLLKYDIRSVFKYWWIAALSSVGFAVIGGVCIQIIDVDYTAYRTIQAFAGLGLALSAIGIALFFALTEVLLVIRFYKHFFTDEGYLTFTLPVKKTALLNSKLISAVGFLLVSMLIVAADIFLMLSVGIPEELFASEFLMDLWQLFADIFQTLGVYAVLYFVLGLLIIMVLSAVQILFIELCITLASSITQRHKVLLGIGIYYGATAALSIVMEIMVVGGVFTVFELIGELSEAVIPVAVLFVFICVLGIAVAAAAGLYLLELYLLDRKLNLE